MNLRRGVTKDTAALDLIALEAKAHWGLFQSATSGVAQRLRPPARIAYRAPSLRGGGEWAATGVRASRHLAKLNLHSKFACIFMPILSVSIINKI
jgi:hypothetical protein